jgi:hypothetical protein
MAFLTPKCRLAFALLLCGAVLLGAPTSARAGEPEAFARVTVDAAELRSGPGVAFRVIYTAHRGESLAVDGRPGDGFWLRVVLPDGRTAYAPGDDLQTFVVDPRAPGAPPRWRLLAPSPLVGAHAGLVILGGAAYVPLDEGGRRVYGYMEARPSIVLDRTVTLDGFVGEIPTSDGSEVFYGGGASVYLAPSWPLCPFLDLGGGGLSVFPGADSFVLQRRDYYLARAGGGLLFAFRKRVLIRLEATNLTLFNSQAYRNAQTFAAGLGVYF